MDPRTIPDLKISRIRAALAEYDELPEAMVAALLRDRRKTVRALAEKPVRKAVERRDMLAHERRLRAQGLTLIAGVDEAGRGPLAGPVCAAAVVLPPECDLPEVCDSKKLSPEQRERLEPEIRRQALFVGEGLVDVELVDRINVLQAAMKAMRMAVADLGVEPQHVLVDGNFTPGCPFPETAIVGGDDSSLSIAAASIIAKVTRDRIMVAMDERYPGYGFARHKGYGTRQHLEALERLGPCAIHRRSFSVVAEAAGGRSPVYMHMSRAIRAAESDDDLRAVGVAVREHVDELTPSDRIVLRRLYRQRRAALARKAKT